MPVFTEESHFDAIKCPVFVERLTDLVIQLICPGLEHIGFIPMF